MISLYVLNISNIRYFNGILGAQVYEFLRIAVCLKINNE